MFGMETKLPVVMCPGFDLTMKAIERKPVAFSNGLVDVTYAKPALPIPLARSRQATKA